MVKGACPPAMPERVELREGPKACDYSLLTHLKYHAREGIVKSGCRKLLALADVEGGQADSEQVTASIKFGFWMPLHPMLQLL